MFGLYIHIPFCGHICSYCDFPKRVPFSDKEIKLYLNKLISELHSYSAYYKDIDTIYIGGGTPNFLSDYDLEYLLKNIHNCNISAKEYTIECNSEYLTLKQANLFKKYGINRVSIGMQTINEDGLKLLNRHHTKEDIRRSINSLLENGITNINIDLIYGYFNQTINDLKLDLDFVLTLPIKHLSCYSLILEDKTLLNLKHKETELDEDLIADMNILINNTLKANKFKHYEISNYAKEGYESRHNLKYWSKEEYIGIGQGATSYLNNKRITNPIYLYKYLNNEEKTIEKLSQMDEMKEFIILGLRKVDGILKKDYIKRFNRNICDDFNYQKLIDYNLLYEDDKILKLTDKGLLLGNIVFEEFL